MGVAEAIATGGELTESVACNLCGSDDPEVLFPAGLAQRNRIVRCRQCGLMYASPRHKLVDSKDYERFEAEGLLLDVDANRDHPFRWRYDKERFQRQDYDEVKRFLNGSHPQRGRLLEVGCSMGQLLDYFREDGWTVQGVDPWKEAALFTAKKMGIPCSPTTLEGAKLLGNSLDVLVMLHVIEHVENPAGTMKEVFRVLKPGGYAVIETPRYDTLMFRLFGRRERSLSCDGHIYFFTAESLQRLCENAGFELVRREYNGRSLSVHRSLWNIAVMTKSKALRHGVESMGTSTGLDRLRLYVNLRDMQRVVVRKPAM